MEYLPSISHFDTNPHNKSLNQLIKPNKIQKSNLQAQARAAGTDSRLCRERLLGPLEAPLQTPSTPTCTSLPFPSLGGQ
jgi:hypothetical protein